MTLIPILTIRVGGTIQISHYRSNPYSVPQVNARQPPKFQGPPFPQQAPQKSNLKATMESMLVEFQEYTTTRGGVNCGGRFSPNN